ncbi:MAG: 3-hydroxyacyl-CoA dehydrogenase NAD-binding domain-containing protein, partial [Phycisphaerales bacterium]|nr:3-hydroxyacyl-CoA dehydrogenase NAD-binding domain-containing protein [Phycisphaerales bacterium]
MGAGIAQIAATSGWPVMLMDVDEPTVRKAIDG